MDQSVDKPNTGKRVPIADAKAIGVKNGYSQVIVVCWDDNTGTTSVTTWGRTQVQCEQAAKGGNFVKKALGWPESMCNDKPARQLRKEKLKQERDEADSSVSL